VLIAGPALLGWGLIGVIIGSLLSEIIHFLLVVFMTYRLWHQNSSEDIGLIRLQRPQRFHQGLRLVRQLWVSASIKGLQLETFVPLLALLTTPAQVGLYRGALDVAQLLARLTEPLQVVIQPTLMQIYQQQPLAVFTRYIRQITLILAGIVVPFLLVVLVFGPQLFAVVFGEEFVGIAPVTSILTVGYGITTMTLWIRPSVIALDRLHEQNIIGIIIFIYTIAALFVASDAGALGAALVMSSALIFYVILSLVVLWRQLRDEQQR
jgi:O-antigen/teichoic acid export membrane protein